jgi:2-amino-4-hydroxy-6-hydroxymethyldihydropteridine diphosphokinase
MSSGWRTATAVAEAHAFIGLGSNLGDRGAHLAGALRGLGRLGSVEAVSSVYETDPVGYVDQPDFWNLVAVLRTDLDPHLLLERIQALEAEAGRVRTIRDGPRPLDLDLLLYGGESLSTPTLVLPHPRLLERRFVLVPLVELAPALLHPVTGRRMTDHLPEVPGRERVHRLFPGARLLAPGGAPA